MQHLHRGVTLLLQVCNMELLSNVSALANELLASDVNISLLVNNAGRFIDEHFTVTKEGLEHTIALDYFGEAPTLAHHQPTLHGRKAAASRQQQPAIRLL
jgi:short-subunit dehydrogenase